MRYRRKGKEIEATRNEWANWLKENADLIAASGLPELIISDEEYWGDFLDHGILDHHFDPSGFRLDQLSIQQKVALLRLLRQRKTYFDTVVGNCLIDSLLDAFDDWYKD